MRVVIVGAGGQGVGLAAYPRRTRDLHDRGRRGPQRAPGAAPLLPFRRARDDRREATRGSRAVYAAVGDTPIEIALTRGRGRGEITQKGVLGNAQFEIRHTILDRPADRKIDIVETVLVED